MPVDPGEILEAMTWLHGFYASPEGLSRPQGLSIDGRPDFEGVAAWVFDVFLNSRLAGLDIDVCKRNVVHAIQQTDEWRSKHPSGTTAAVSSVPFNRTVAMDRGEFFRALHCLDLFYKSWNGLQRPDGLSIHGQPDFEAIAAWIFGVYLSDRMSNWSPERSWDHVVNEIERSDEWQSRSRPPVDASTLHDKHLLGYQGWFGTPEDGQQNGWDHWFRGGMPTASAANFDYWPDTREFFDSELAATSIRMRNGEPARLFSSHNERTLRRHFDWLADARVDGVSLGRFLAGTQHAQTRGRLDGLLQKVRVAAEATGRVFFVWYDVTDSSHQSFVFDLSSDWLHLVRDLQITQSRQYLRHRGKPLVGIWGAGAEGRPSSTAEWLRAISFFKDHPSSGATVLLGGARDWRVNQTWAAVFAAADVVSPWAVTGFLDEAGADSYRRDLLEPDLALTRSRGQDYMPVLFPGFSWHNLQQRTVPINGIARHGGRFYWRQAFNCVEAGVTNLFTAMFDELDEGTAMLKMVETERDLPSEGTFLPLDVDGDRLPSDWYLRLAGAAGRMLRREQPLTSHIPIRP